jgi:hypothetical protein
MSEEPDGYYGDNEDFDADLDLSFLDEDGEKDRDTGSEA